MNVLELEQKYGENILDIVDYNQEQEQDILGLGSKLCNEIESSGYDHTDIYEIVTYITDTENKFGLDVLTTILKD